MGTVHGCGPLTDDLLRDRELVLAQPQHCRILGYAAQAAHAVRESARIVRPCGFGGQLSFRQLTERIEAALERRATDWRDLLGANLLRQSPASTRLTGCGFFPRQL